MRDGLCIAFRLGQILGNRTCDTSAVNETSVPLASRETVERFLDFPSLIEAIRRAFLHPPITPQRLAIPIEDTEEQPGGTALVMPSLQPASLLGVKIITIQPKLSERPGGATRAIYVAVDARSGELKGLIDGHALTLRRTAATSMLAAQVMAMPNPKTVLGNWHRIPRYGTGKRLCRKLPPRKVAHLGTTGSQSSSRGRRIRRGGRWSAMDIGSPQRSGLSGYRHLRHVSPRADHPGSLRAAGNSCGSGGRVYA